MKLYDINKSDETKQDAFINGRVPVAVYGLGKMGLPLAAVYAEVSRNVRGIDIDANVVETVNRGETPFDHEPGLDDLIAETVSDDVLRATTNSTGAAAEAAVHVVIVPTLITEENKPDLSALQAVVSDIASGLDQGDLVVIESTVPPRTCEDVVVPLLEAESSLSRGDFGVAFCPERTKSGRALKDIRGNFPKVVGGIDVESTRAAELIYRNINTNDVVPVSDATTAEAVKLFEGVYRDVNIGLVNELAKLVDETGFDALEAIDVANDVPYVDLHAPGAGVGGHCIPYYPYFLIEEFDSPTPMLETGRKINDSMPAFTVDKLLEGLNECSVTVSNSTVVVLGLTYHPGIPEIRHTPAKPVVDRLTGQGASVYVVDPILDDFSAFEKATPIDLDEVYDINPDAFALVTAHEEFESIDWEQFEELAIVDGRDAIETNVERHWLYTVGAGRK